jgi:hypothetical protein
MGGSFSELLFRTSGVVTPRAPYSLLPVAKPRLIAGVFPDVENESSEGCSGSSSS